MSSQMRKSVSVRGTTYQRIADYVATTGGSLSGFLEEVITEHLGTTTEEDHQKFDQKIAEEHKEAHPPDPDPEPSRARKPRIAALQPKIEVPKTETQNESPLFDDYVPPNLLL